MGSPDDVLAPTTTATNQQPPIAPAQDQQNTEPANDAQDQQVTVEKGARSCEVCEAAPFRYKCPGCGCKTCSLGCSRQHKEDTGCSGQRDRTAFVGIKDFDDRQLMSDYNLLEEIRRVDDVAARHRPPGARPQLPHHLASLVHQARIRGTRLLIMPPGLQRRKSNTTRYDGRTRTLMWRVEWSFPCAGTSLVNERVADSSCIADLLRAHLTYKPGAAAKQFPLQAYSDAGVDSLLVLMKRERAPANQPGYFRLSPQASLASQLAGKLVLEYPTLIVALPSEAGQYPEVPQDPRPPPYPNPNGGAQGHDGAAGPGPGSEAAAGGQQGPGWGPPRGRGRAGRGDWGRGGGRGRGQGRGHHHQQGSYGGGWEQQQTGSGAGAFPPAPPVPPPRPPPGAPSAPAAGQAAAATAATAIGSHGQQQQQLQAAGPRVLPPAAAPPASAHGVPPPRPPPGDPPSATAATAPVPHQQGAPAAVPGPRPPPGSPPAAGSNTQPSSSPRAATAATAQLSRGTAAVAGASIGPAATTASVTPAVANLPATAQAPPPGPAPVPAPARTPAAATPGPTIGGGPSLAASTRPAPAATIPSPAQPNQHMAAAQAAAATTTAAGAVTPSATAAAKHSLPVQQQAKRPRLDMGDGAERPVATSQADAGGPGGHDDNEIEICLDDMEAAAGGGACGMADENEIDLDL